MGEIEQCRSLECQFPCFSFLCLDCPTHGCRHLVLDIPGIMLCYPVHRKRYSLLGHCKFHLIKYSYVTAYFWISAMYLHHIMLYLQGFQSWVVSVECKAMESQLSVHLMMWLCCSEQTALSVTLDFQWTSKLVSMSSEILADAGLYMHIVSLEWIWPWLDD